MSFVYGATENALVLAADPAPLGFDTVTDRVVVKALLAIVTRTLSCVELMKVVVVVMLPPLMVTVAPGWKPVPVTITVSVVPRLPEDGDTESIARLAVGGGGGGGALMVTDCAAVELTPPLPSLTVRAIKCAPTGNLTLATAVVAMTMP